MRRNFIVSWSYRSDARRHSRDRRVIQKKSNYLMKSFIWDTLWNYFHCLYFNFSFSVIMTWQFLRVAGTGLEAGTENIGKWRKTLKFLLRYWGWAYLYSEAKLASTPQGSISCMTIISFLRNDRLKKNLWPSPKLTKRIKGPIPGKWTIYHQSYL